MLKSLRGLSSDHRRGRKSLDCNGLPPFQASEARAGGLRGINEHSDGQPDGRLTDGQERYQQRRAPGRGSVADDLRVASPFCAALPITMLATIVRLLVAIRLKASSETCNRFH